MRSSISKSSGKSIANNCYYFYLGGFWSQPQEIATRETQTQPLFFGLSRAGSKDRTPRKTMIWPRKFLSSMTSTGFATFFYYCGNSLVSHSLQLLVGAWCLKIWINELEHESSASKSVETWLKIFGSWNRWEINLVTSNYHRDKVVMTVISVLTEKRPNWPFGVNSLSFLFYASHLPKFKFIWHIEVMF